MAACIYRLQPGFMPCLNSLQTGLESGCILPRNKCRESCINPFSVFIWADGIHQPDDAAHHRTSMEFLQCLTVSSATSKHPKSFWMFNTSGRLWETLLLLTTTPKNLFFSLLDSAILSSDQSRSSKSLYTRTLLLHSLPCQALLCDYSTNSFTTGFT